VTFQLGSVCRFENANAGATRGWRTGLVLATHCVRTLVSRRRRPLSAGACVIGYARHVAPTETGPTTPFMPFINLRDTPIRLPAGQLRIGRGRGVEISLPAASHVATAGEDALTPANGTDIGNRQGQFALLVVDPSGSATLSKLSEEAPVYLNSVPAGLEPTPLLHGDRVEIDGVELRYSDDRSGGSTAEFPVLSPQQAELLPPPTPAPKGAIRDAGAQSARVRAPVKNGRLISLVDGREYAVTDDGLAIGRDAGCDVVVPANSVSRRHARIALEVRGYTITDSSTNGVTVSGERVRSTRLLKRGDVIRVGPEEFRFYEEEAAADPTPPAPVAPPRIETPFPMPGAADRAKGPVLATFVLSNQGAERGKVFEVTSLLTHIGRGAHNDIVLDDDSVSDSHAKLQRRDNRWIVSDVGSTNGTYAGGERLTGEVELRGDTDIRFGGAKFMFKPARLVRTPSGGTRVVAAFTKKKSPTPSEPVPIVGAEAPASGEEVDEGPDESKRSLAILWVALLGVLALTVSVILRALL
jgi:pSer/pThr/pTyr-binding forkhead associated (FHA) protein